MFSPHRPRNMLEAATTTLGLIYDAAVMDVRKTHGNPIIGLLMTLVQALVMVMGFMLIYIIMGVRTSPIRGPYVVYLLSGVLLFMTHSKTHAAVAGAPKASSSQMLHAPMTPAVAIGGAALSVLYKQALVFSAMTYGYHVLFGPLVIENLIGAIGVFMMGWLSGIAVGLCFYAATPWAPTPIGVLSMAYGRANMVFSGKFFVANMMSPSLMAWFDWNPLFHLVDQGRGYLFINYTPYFTSMSYAIKVTVALMMIGLMGEFVTRKSVSASWTAGR